MRKVILWMGVSVDGFFEGPDHDISWHRIDEELHTHVNAELGRAGAFLEGRVMYELMEEFWPTADQQTGVSAPVAEFARIWREMPKIVYSRTLDDVGSNATLVREVVPQDVLALKAKPGGDLILGGADIAATFISHDLVDEYRIYVHPVVVGEGRRLFPPGAHIDLTLVESRAFGNGVVLLRWVRDGGPGTQ